MAKTELGRLFCFKCKKRITPADEGVPLCRCVVRTRQPPSHVVEHPCGCMLYCSTHVKGQ